MLDGLQGSALGSGGVIRIFNSFNHVQPKVTTDRPDQHPLFKAELEENFPLALYLARQVSRVAGRAAPLGEICLRCLYQLSLERA
jgi:hypothetical protein